jgi:hypothetical protein
VTKTSVVSSFPLFKSLLFYSSQLSAKKTALKARHWWLMPVILPTQEAEISRIAVQSQPRQISSRAPILKIPITKRACGVAQVKALSSSPSTAKKKKNCIEYLS